MSPVASRSLREESRLFGDCVGSAHGVERAEHSKIDPGCQIDVSSAIWINALCHRGLEVPPMRRNATSLRGRSGHAKSMFDCGVWRNMVSW